jgi:hypothetical protein
LGSISDISTLRLSRSLRQYETVRDFDPETLILTLGLNVRQGENDRELRPSLSLGYGKCEADTEAEVEHETA